MKVFLGGTCNGSTWRDILIPLLKIHHIDYFNPVVEDWTPSCQEEERREKAICDVHLYIITPAMTGVFSIAEIIDSAHLLGKRCIVQIVPSGWSDRMFRSLEAVAQLAGKYHTEVIWEEVDDPEEDFNWILNMIKYGG